MNLFLAPIQGVTIACYRNLEIIDELEPTCRHLYTGSIGYIGFDGDSLL